MSLPIDPTRAWRILALAMPVVIAMLTQTSINLVDTYFIGQLDPALSIPGQAALGFSLPMLWAFGGSLSALGIGAQVMTARRVGAGQPHASGSILANALLLCAAASLLMTALGWWSLPHLFDFLTDNAEIAALGIPYGRLRILGVLSMVATAVYKGFFDGLSQTKVHMYAAIVMNAANIGLNYVLIFGLGPIPALEITGAGVASLISTFIGLFILMAWSKRARFASFEIYRPAQLRLQTMWELIKLSVPSAMAQLFIMTGVVMFLKIIASLDDRATAELLATWAAYGGEQLAALDHLDVALSRSPELGVTLLAQDLGATLLSARPPLFSAAAKLIIDLLLVGFVTCIAFGTATATLISQQMGKRDYQGASDYGWDSVKLGMIFYGALGLLLIWAPHQALGLLSNDASVIAEAAPAMQLMGGMQMCVATGLILTQALFGAGATRFVMVVEFLLHGFCLAPMAYLFAFVFDWGFVGVWCSATLYVFLLALAMALKFWHGTWTEIEL